MKLKMHFFISKQFGKIFCSKEHSVITNLLLVLKDNQTKKTVMKSHDFPLQTSDLLIVWGYDVLSWESSRD